MANVNDLRTTFYKLGTPQKKEFIDRLSMQPSTHKNPQYSALLNECINVYSQEAHAAAAAPKKPPSRAAILAAEVIQKQAEKQAARQQAIKSFTLAKTPDKYILCPGCRTRLDVNAEFCTSCGIDPNATARPTEEPEYPEFTVYTSAPFVNHDAGSFTARMHSYGKSQMFFSGIILWTVGSVLGILLSFSLFSIISLGLLALPVTGLFMLYSASVKPIIPEKSLTSFTLFNVSAIIQLVFICIVAAFVAIAFLGLGVLGAVLSSGTGAMIFLSFLLSAAIFAAYIYFYYVSLFRILKGMREGVMRNIIKPLRGVTPFLVISYVSIAFTVVNALIAIAARNYMVTQIRQMLRVVPDIASPLISSLLPGSTIMQLVNLLAAIITSTGMILCLVTLSNFNSSLKK